MKHRNTFLQRLENIHPAVGDNFTDLSEKDLGSYPREWNVQLQQECHQPKFFNV